MRSQIRTGGKPVKKEPTKNEWQCSVDWWAISWGPVTPAGTYVEGYREVRTEGRLTLKRGQNDRG